MKNGGHDSTFEHALEALREAWEEWDVDHELLSTRAKEAREDLILLVHTISDFEAD